MIRIGLRKGFMNRIGLRIRIDLRTVLTIEERERTWDSWLIDRRVRIQNIKQILNKMIELKLIELRISFKNRIKIKLEKVGLRNS